MNVIPIKVENEFSASHKFVEWMIHNVCNYQCSFCIPEVHNGSQRWLTLEQYKKYADEIISASNGMPVWLQITGGEPTLFPELMDLLKYIKRPNVYVSLISNGSRTFRWWQELKNEHCLDHLFITYHSEQTSDYKHITDLLNLFHDEPVKTFCLITHAKNSVDQAIEAKHYVQQNTGSVILLKPMIVDKKLHELPYTEEQLKEVKKSWAAGNRFATKTKPNFPEEVEMSTVLKIIYSDNSSEKIRTDQMIQKKLNNFFDWKCYVGEDTMRIVKDQVYRGVCQLGGVQSVLGETPVKFSEGYIKCTNQWCLCNTDMKTTKIR